MFTFLSIPDLFNGDLGDVSDAANWEPGDPNSINGQYQRAIDVVFNDLAAEGSQAVLVAGDLVQGHWGRDSIKTGIFGPVGTASERESAMRRAGSQYYSEYTQRFESRGMTLYAAVGDHDIGDNPWRTGVDEWTDWKRNHLATFRQVWANNFTDAGTRFANHPINSAYDQTAYATYLTDDVLLVTVDTFNDVPDNIIAECGDRQLDWFRDTIREGKERGAWIIVQGHVPVLSPVRERHSSGLHYVGGKTSRFWELMVNNGVDLYLCGEVHDNTVIVPDVGPTQISHGGLFRRGHTSFLRGDIDGDTMSLQIKDWNAREITRETVIWQTDTLKNITTGIEYDAGPKVIGSMTLTKSGTSNREGVMAPYLP